MQQCIHALNGWWKLIMNLIVWTVELSMSTARKLYGKFNGNWWGIGWSMCLQQSKINTNYLTANPSHFPAKSNRERQLTVFPDKHPIFVQILSASLFPPQYLMHQTIFIRLIKYFYIFLNCWQSKKRKKKFLKLQFLTQISWANKLRRGKKVPIKMHFYLILKLLFALKPIKVNCCENIYALFAVDWLICHVTNIWGNYWVSVRCFWVEICPF